MNPYPNTYYIMGSGWVIYHDTNSLLLGLTPACVDIAHTSISIMSDWINAIDPLMLKRVPLDIDVWIYDNDIDNFGIQATFGITRYLILCKDAINA